MNNNGLPVQEKREKERESRMEPRFEFIIKGLATSQLSQDGFLFLTNHTSNNLYLPLDDERYPNSIIVSFLIYRVKIHFSF